MSLKMCALLLGIVATHGLIEGIKNRKGSYAYLFVCAINQMRLLTRVYVQVQTQIIGPLVQYP